MKKICNIFFLSLIIIVINAVTNYGQITDEGSPLPSIESENDLVTPAGTSLSNESPTSRIFKPGKFTVDKMFEGFGFDDNQTENISPVTGNGVRFIPPDPIGAAGKSRVIAVVNTMIESRTKGGVLVWRDGLKDFFAPVEPTTFTFDPKIVYDEHTNRFVVVTLEQVTGGTTSVSDSNLSRILLAVSKNGNPQTPTSADWYYHAINSKTVIPRPVNPFDHWADYPGFEVDEEAIYITANMFTFVPFGSFGGVRLWIVDKGFEAGGFYDGGVAAVTVHNPYEIPGSVATTTMPAQVHGAGGAGPGIGTYLVSYSGLSDGVDEYIQVVRVDNPVTSPTFTQEFINIGNIETGFPALPGAPQLGSEFTINVNDRRALDAVWRDNSLWIVTTLRPNSGPDVNQTTAAWVKLNTSAVINSSSPADLITFEDIGYIGGEDIAASTFTFFPSVAINKNNNAMFGFSASAPTIYAGAYVTGRLASDPSGTVKASLTVKAGEAPYKRFFGGNRNRWGDYSGISVDPTNEDFVWVFNEFADDTGNATNGAFGYENGRWGTAWGRAKFSGMASKDLAINSVEQIYSYRLDQNYPNPFNPSTVISYELAEGSSVSLKIFDALGREVTTLVDAVKPAGLYQVNFNAGGLPSGFYFYKIQTGDFISTKKMILLK